MWSPICDIFDKPYGYYTCYPVDLTTSTFAICEECGIDMSRINLFVDCKEEQREHGLLGVDWAFAFRALEGWPAALDEIERLQEENKMLKKNLAECAGY